MQKEVDFFLQEDEGLPDPYKVNGKMKREKQILNVNEQMNAGSGQRKAGNEKPQEEVYPRGKSQENSGQVLSLMLEQDLKTTHLPNSHRRHRWKTD